MIDELGVFQPVGRFSIEIDHAGAATRATAGEAHIRFARFAWTVHDTADDRERHRRGDMLQPVFQHAHSFNDIESLPRAGWARNDIDTAMAQVERLQNIEARANLVYRVSGQRNPDRVADAGRRSAGV